MYITRDRTCLARIYTINILNCDARPYSLVLYELCKPIKRPIMHAMVVFATCSCRKTNIFKHSNFIILILLYHSAQKVCLIILFPFIPIYLNFYKQSAWKSEFQRCQVRRGYSLTLKECEKQLLHSYCLWHINPELRSAISDERNTITFVIRVRAVSRPAAL